LISRARQTCRVFANFESGDLDLKRSSQRGVAVLKTFLNYAKTRVLDVPDLGSDVTDSPFEDSVILALRGLGYEIRSQIGSGGFKVDIGVVDQERPGSYLIGIECDGATYHSAKWARDRDRLREEVLKRLGWRIHRIWSTDYFRNPEKEIRRTVEAIERARLSKGVVVGETASDAIEEFRVERSEENRPAEKATVSGDYWIADFKINLNDQGLHELPVANFTESIESVVDVEAPVHKDEVLRRIMSACGVNRAGTRIRSTYGAALSHAIRSRKRIKKSGDFLWAVGKIDIKVRDRSGLDNSARNIEMIAPEEIALAFAQVVERAHSIENEELLLVVASSFGIQRVTSNIKTLLEKQLRKLIKSGVLVLDGGRVIMPD
jgi:very-short-patch-repair endonuclease